MNAMIEDGIILIDKPAGITSFGVVSRIRRQLSQHFGRKMKVGHTGTLDPFATGLMILVVGKECKNAEKYSKLDKVYLATIRLGCTSSTGDPEGELIDVSGVAPSEEAVGRALEKFKGTISQVPPNYSAIKINGQRAYKLARAGTIFEIPKREVTIFSLDLIEYSYPNLKVCAHASSGTYIRTLAEDIGAALKVGGYCLELRRISIGEWDITKATKEFELDI
jgi:tRNA pseudouridine55 synthase